MRYVSGCWDAPKWHELCEEWLVAASGGQGQRRSVAATRSLRTRERATAPGRVLRLVQMAGRFECVMRGVQIICGGVPGAVCRRGAMSSAGGARVPLTAHSLQWHDVVERVAVQWRNPGLASRGMQEHGSE